MLKPTFIALLFVVHSGASSYDSIETSNENELKSNGAWVKLQGLTLGIGYKSKELYSTHNSIIDTTCVDLSFGKIGVSSFSLSGEWLRKNDRKDFEYKIKHSHLFKSPKYFHAF